MQFPDSLPNPDVGAAIEFKGAHREQVFDGGRRITRQARSRPNIYPVRWQLSEAQRVDLEAFHRLTGAQYFLMLLPAPDGWQMQQVRFAGQLSFSYRGVDAWDCSSKLLLMQPAYLTAAKLEDELIAMLGDWQDLSFSAELDSLVNNTLPAILG
ncbi:hypothetical protein [Endozoicomonas sp. GU-1]|uniref:hypothetical protein n=1 Tax=Endozoicomonas sp. GU-1 TaxID=3009078 RepID=UPI0022B35893|nr:hypothetical protein [Endozoicomonas sp. GU-1]WBA79546.1 hypothetical protein O2T12_14275 [Endozoicomonas sp. GU-1]